MGPLGNGTGQAPGETDSAFDVEIFDENFSGEIAEALLEIIETQVSEAQGNYALSLGLGETVAAASRERAKMTPKIKNALKLGSVAYARKLKINLAKSPEYVIGGGLALYGASQLVIASTNRSAAKKAKAARPGAPQPTAKINPEKL